MSKRKNVSDNGTVSRIRYPILCLVLAIVAVSLTMILCLPDDSAEGIPYGESDEINMDSGGCDVVYDSITKTITVSPKAATEDGADYTIGVMKDYASDAPPPWYSYRTSVTTIVIDDGVICIGRYSFNDFTVLTNIDFSADDDLTTINDCAFRGCTELKAVTIPDTVTLVDGSDDGGCFRGCSSLENVVIGSGMTEIPKSILRDCTKLYTVTIRGSPTIAWAYAFQGCIALTSLVFTEDRTSTFKIIDYQAFMNCTSLGSIDLSNVTELRKQTFQNCALSDVTLPAVQQIEEKAFYGCSGLKSITLPDSVKEIGLAFSGTNIGKVTVISTTADKGEKLFDQYNLGSWKLRDSGKIGTIEILSDRLSSAELQALSTSKNANDGFTLIFGADVNYSAFGNFLYVSGLDCTTDRNGLTFKFSNGKINCNSQTCGTNLFWVFDTNDKILYFTTTSENTVTMGSYTEGSMPWSRYMSEIETLDIPDNVKTIGAYAFMGCTGITAITTSSCSFTSIGQHAFDGCTGLSITGLTVSTSVGDYSFAGTKVETFTSSCAIGEYAFNGCTSLTTVTLSLKSSVGTNAFNGCTSLDTLSISDSVTVSDNAFYGCTSLKEIMITSGSGDNSESLFGTDNLASWKLNGQTSGYITSITMNSTTTDVTHFNQVATSASGIGKSIVIPKGITKYSLAPDNKGYGLYINFGHVPSSMVSCSYDGITFTGTSDGSDGVVFNYEQKYNDVYWVYGTSVLNDYPYNTLFLEGKGDMGTGVIPWSSLKDRVEYVALIADKSTLGTITSIADNCFKDFGKLKGFIGNPYQIISVGSYAFSGCTSFGADGITFDGLVSVGSYAFSGCGNLKLSLPKTLTSVGSHAFQSCTSLTTVRISADSSMGDNAFLGAGLETIYVSDSTVIAKNAFSGCSKLKNVVITNGSGTLSSNLFGTDNLGSWKLDGMDSDVITVITIESTGLDSENILALTNGKSKSGFTIIVKNDSYDSGSCGLCVSTLDVATPRKGLSFESSSSGFNCTSQTCGKDLYWVVDTKTPDHLILYITGSGTAIRDAEDEGDVYWGDYRANICEVSIPKQVTNIGAFAFYGCGNLSNFISYPSALKVLGKYALYNCTGLDTTVTMVNLDTIGAFALAGCSNVTVNSLSSISYIGESAFEGIKLLTAVSIQDSVELENLAFKGCDGNTELTIVAGTGAINESLFNDSLKDWKLTGMESSFTKIVIKSDRLIGSSDGYDYLALMTSENNAISGRSLVIYDGLTAYDNGGSGLYVSGYDVATPRGGMTFEAEDKKFNNKDQKCGDSLYWVYDSSEHILYFTGSGAMYDFTEGNTPWNDHTSEIETVGYKMVITRIGNYAFSGCENLASFTDNLTKVTHIGEHAFHGCGFEIGTFTNLSTVGQYAFSGFSDSLSVSSTLTGVGAYAFHESGITSVTISGTIGASAFQGCEGLTNVVLASGAKVNGTNVFNGCTLLTSIDIADTVTMVTDAFAGSSISKVTITPGTGTLSDSLFDTNNLGDWTLDGMTGGTVTEITIKSTRLVGEIVKITGKYYVGKSLILSSTVGTTYDGEGLGLCIDGEDKEWIKASRKFVGMNVGGKDIYNSQTNPLKTITVKFVTGDGTFVDPESISFTSDEYSMDLSEKTTTRTGYGFTGWYYRGNYCDGSVTFIYSDVEDEPEIVADWAKKKFTITFYLDSEKKNEYTSITDYYEESIIVPENPKMTGYSFVKWDPAIPITMPAENTECVATWNLNTYYVHYHARGGEGTMDDKSFNYLTGVTLDANIFTKKGYSFNGWSVDESIPFVKYFDKAVLKGIDYDVNLYASWTANKYQVSFEPEGGTGTMGLQKMTYDKSYNLSSNVFTRDGYYFAGWAESSGGAVKYTDGEKVSNLSSKKGDVVHLYAVWSPYVCIVKFVPQGGTGEEMTDQVFEYGAGTQLLKPNTFSLYGYNFAGWYCIETKYTYGDNVDPEFVFDEKEKKLTFSAIWTAKQCELKYSVNGEIRTVKQLYGTDLNIDPVWDKHTLLYWTPALPTKMPYNDTTVYVSVWEVTKYQLTIVPNNGESTKYYAIPVDSTISVTIPSWEGHILVGWDKKFPTTMPEKDITLSAVWGVMVDGVIVTDIQNGQSFVPIISDGLIELRTSTTTSVTLNASDIKDMLVTLSITETVNESPVKGKAYIVKLSVEDATEAAEANGSLPERFIVTLPSSSSKHTVYKYFDGVLTDLEIESFTDEKITFMSEGNGVYVVESSAESASVDSFPVILAVALAMMMAMMMFVVVVIGSRKKDRGN